MFATSNKLTLEKVIKLVRAAEVIKQQMKTMNADACVNSIRYWQKNTTHQRHCICKTHAMVSHSHDKQQPSSSNCKYFAKEHPPNRCPAYGKTCMKCKSKNHFAVVCVNPRRPRPPRHVDEVVLPEYTSGSDYSEDSDSDDGPLFFNTTETNGDLYVGSINVDDKWHTILHLENAGPVTFTLDTGA